MKGDGGITVPNACTRLTRTIRRGSKTRREVPGEISRGGVYLGCGTLFHFASCYGNSRTRLNNLEGAGNFRKPVHRISPFKFTTGGHRAPLTSLRAPKTNSFFVFFFFSRGISATRAWNFHRCTTAGSTK